ncbi:MAG: TIGR00266 family protein [Myxococcales bacterium]|nr:MAG: TIGR00266 family protein [Myxococcales bacterium]
MSEALQFNIEQQPDFALLSVQLQPGQKIQAEPSAMASMDPSVHMKAGLKGGLMKSLGRAFGGESMIVNTFTAKGRPSEVTFAPGPMGDINHYRLQGQTLYLQRGSYLANTEGVQITGSWQGAKGFFSGEGLVLLQATGEGDVFFNTYGGLIEIDVQGHYIVDTGYIVAFEETLNYKVGIMPGLNLSSKLKTFFFGGEALVCTFSGQGKLWIQTRAVRPFLRFLHPFRPRKKRG